MKLFGFEIKKPSPGEVRLKAASQNIDPITGDKIEPWWRNISSGLREINPQLFEKQLKTASKLWLLSPEAKRVIESKKNLILGDGIKIVADEEKTQEVIDAFWNDPVNRWGLKQFSRVRELFLYGEQIYPVVVEDYVIRLGYVDPLLVKDIKYHELNQEIPEEVEIGLGAGDSKTFRVINTLFSDYDNLEDTCFYFAVNKLTGMKRGVSDLMVLMDTLEKFDQSMENELERGELLKNFIWDVTLQGMNDQEIEEWLRKQSIPKPGSIRAHNELVEWKDVTPDLKAAFNEKLIDEIRNRIAVGSGLPKHWLAGIMDVNRATAKDMSEQAYKNMKEAQGYVREMFKTMIDVQIEVAITKRKLPDEEKYRKYSIVMPELEEEKFEEAGNVIMQLTNAITMAVNMNFIDEERGAKLFQYVLKKFGLWIE